MSDKRVDSQRPRHCIEPIDAEHEREEDAEGVQTLLDVVAENENRNLRHAHVDVFYVLFDVQPFGDQTYKQIICGQD